MSGINPYSNKKLSGINSSAEISYVTKKDDVQDSSIMNNGIVNSSDDGLKVDSSNALNESVEEQLTKQLEAELVALEASYNAEKESQGFGGWVADIFGGGAEKLKKELETKRELLSGLIKDPSKLSQVYEKIMGEVLTKEKIAQVEASQELNNTLTVDDKKAIVARLQAQATSLNADLNKSVEGQGWFSKAIGWINNGLDFGTSENNSKAQIKQYQKLVSQLDPNSDDFLAQYKAITSEDLTVESASDLLKGTSKVANSEAAESILDYEQTQETATEIAAGVATAIVVVAAVAAVPFTGGTSLAAIALTAGFAAGVGGTTMLAVKASNGLTSDEGYTVEQGVRDFASGAIEGALIPVSGGIGSSVASSLGKTALSTGAKAVISGAVAGATYGGVYSGGNYIAQTAGTENFSWETLGETTLTGTLSGAVAGGVAGGVNTFIRPALASGETTVSQVAGRLATGGVTGLAAGTAGGAIGGGTNYLLNSDGEEITFEGWIEATANGAGTGAVVGLAAGVTFEAVNIAAGAPKPENTRSIKKETLDNGIKVKNYYDKDGNIIATDVKASDMKAYLSEISGNKLTTTNSSTTLSTETTQSINLAERTVRFSNVVKTVDIPITEEISSLDGTVIKTQTSTQQVTFNNKSIDSFEWNGNTHNYWNKTSMVQPQAQSNMPTYSSNNTLNGQYLLNEAGASGVVPYENQIQITSKEIILTPEQTSLLQLKGVNFSNSQTAITNSTATNESQQIAFGSLSAQVGRLASAHSINAANTQTGITNIESSNQANDVTNISSTSILNQESLIRIDNVDQAVARASMPLQDKSIKLAVVGYSAAPKGYEASTQDFLNGLIKEMGVENVGLITSPTASKGSVDAMTILAAQTNQTGISLVTAEDYVGYIDLSQFPENVNVEAFNNAQKVILPDSASYSEVVSKTANTLLVTGGRNVSVLDFKNALEQGNRIVILDNNSLGGAQYDAVKNRPNNAAAYLIEQIDAINNGEVLPYPECEGLTKEFLEEYKGVSNENVLIVDINDETAILKAAQFIQGENQPLTAKSPIVASSKVSMLSKPSQVEAFIPDLNASEEQLLAQGFQKEADGWHVLNRDWFPKPLTDKDIVIVYKRGIDGKPTDMGFCSQEEFSRIYANTDKYKSNVIEYIDANKLAKGETISATKCASGEVCILPEGTILSTNEGSVMVKPGDAIIVNEAKNSLYATNMSETILARYTADPMNPASKELFNLLKDFELNQASMTPAQLSDAHANIADKFNRLNRGQKLYEIANKSAERAPQTLNEEYTLASNVVKDIDTKYFTRIDVSDFDKALVQAKQVLKEIKEDPNLSQTQKDVATTAVMVRLLPKTNAHQHLKGSVPQNVTLELASKKGYSAEEVAKIQKAYQKGEVGYDNLNEFSESYGIIGRPVNTPEDYEAAIKGIMHNAAEQGQLTVEIRCAVDSLRTPEGGYLSPNEGAEIIIAAIDKVRTGMIAEGIEPPKTGFVFLSYRGKDWDGSISGAISQAKEAVKVSVKYPDKKFGFDIAGPEDTGYGPKAFKEAFDIIKEHNAKVDAGLIKAEKIGITVHAGETPTFDGGRPGYLSVEEAIDMGVNRIGHGIQAVLSPATMQKVADAGVTVEICGVCNVSSIPINTQGLAKHPIQEFIDKGIPVTISTDNDAICGTNVSKEYMQFLLTGHDSFMNWNNVKQTVRQGIKSSFISNADKIDANKILEERINKIQKLVEDSNQSNP